MSEFKLDYQECYVAFLDVLGFKDMVLNQDPRVVESCIETILGERDEVDGSEMKILVVSDSIVIAVPAGIENLKWLVSVVGVVQGHLVIREKVFLRGGISFGKIHFDPERGILVGPAFIEAVLLEKAAEYPRVMLDPKIPALNRFSRTEFLSHFATDDFYGRLLHGSKDGCIFVNYLWDQLVYCDQSTIANLYKIVESMIHANSRTAKKFVWVRNYILELLDIMSTLVDDASISPQVVNEAKAKFKRLRLNKIGFYLSKIRGT